MSLLNQTAEYALRTMACFALQAPGRAMRAADVASMADIPHSYASKILRRLVVTGLLTSRRGHGGGFALAGPPEETPLLRVLEAVGAAPASGACAFGWGACDAEHPCPLHPVWSDLDEMVRHWATSNTLADIASIDWAAERQRLGRSKA